MAEPFAEYATVRIAEDCDGAPCYHIETRFSDGQKFVSAEVDGGLPDLAHFIADSINQRAEKRREQGQS